MNDLKSSWIVLKFGGTSVASEEHWQNILNIVKSRRDQKHRVLIVVSALAGISNALQSFIDGSKEKSVADLSEFILQKHLQLATSLGIDSTAIEPRIAELHSAIEELVPDSPGSSEQAAKLMSYGEILASEIGAQFLSTNLAGKTNCHWLDAREILIAKPQQRSATHHFLAANCEHSPDPSAQNRLAELGNVIITQGFVARDQEDRTVLLGRGGSDTSATCFASILQAQRVEIWTDVAGVFSTNPAIHPGAKLIPQLTFEEAQEIAATGGKVLHPHSIKPLRGKDIPLWIGQTLSPEQPGTRILSRSAADDSVKAICVRTGITLLTLETLDMWQASGFLANVFECFRVLGLSVDLISTSESSVTLTLDNNDNLLKPGVLQDLTKRLERYSRVSIVEGCAAVSIVGNKIRGQLHKLAPALGIFETYKVHMLSQASNDLNFTLVVDQENAERICYQLHDLLFGGTTDVHSWQSLRSEQSRAPESYWWQDKRQSLIDLYRGHERPIYVYNQETIAAQATNLKQLNAVDTIFYALKANNNPDVIRTLASRGIRFECVSMAEVDYLREVLPDLPPQDILFTPNFAPKTEYAQAMALGVTVNLDSSYTLENWPELFAGRAVFLRLDPGVGKGHHQHVKTAGNESKFGIKVSELERVKALVAKHNIEIIGLHAHAGSGILGSDHWAEIARFLAAQIALFPSVSVLNLGGGLGVPEKPEELPLDLHSLNQSLLEFRTEHPTLSLWLEPGRYLVAESGVLIAEVTQVKNKSGHRYIGLNTGMNSLIRPALYGAYHYAVNLSRIDAPLEIHADLVGPICETADKLGVERYFPESFEEDLVLIGNTGAYCEVMSSRYNLREPATACFMPQEEPSAG